MLCKIADLLIDVPAAGGMTSRCKDYVTSEVEKADIVIRSELYRPERYPNSDETLIAYLESGWQFYRQLLAFDGMLLHASAVAYEGRAYLFSGPCGMGKSTHTRLWQQLFGEKAVVFNDDKPALRCLNGRWYAYGTPWCGKDGINVNTKVPLAGICFLKRGDENSIRPLSGLEGAKNLLAQTLRRFKDESNLTLALSMVDRLMADIPLFELKNRPEPDAARLSYQTMRRAAEEVGL
ncbi:MAG: hypothetical protein E7655_04200 [Ruminococcaceae bacterium]|nr:hypothetical protein [Oscillospiraceae bacterium]